MRNKGRKNNDYMILVICRQSLKDVQSAVRAYNMYQGLEKLNCQIFYLDGWKPGYKFNGSNIKNWAKVLFFKRFNKKHSRIFIENVQPYFVIKLLAMLKIPIILDVRDDHNLHAESMGIYISKKTYLMRELAQIENFMLAEKIMVTSKSYAMYYSQKYGKQYDEKIVVIMNASDPIRFRRTPIPNEPRIGILGGANWGAGFDLLCDASRIVKTEIPDLSVHIGYKCIPETKKYAESLKEKYNESWIHFYEDIGYQSGAAEFYSSLKLCVIPLLQYKHYDITTPSRLFDIMASARPLVVTDLKEQANIVKNVNCGLVCGFDPKSMASKITKLLKNKKMTEKCGLNGRRAVEVFHNWSFRAKKIVEKVLTNTA